MCVTVVGTVRATFDIAADDLARVLILARREVVTSAALYRRAVAEYLVNHGDPEWFADSWPVGDGLRSKIHGSAPTDFRAGVGDEVR